MPLLGKKVFFLAKPLTTLNPDETIYEIKATGERFRSKDEYDKRVQLYSEKIWTCQCTGQMNLTYEAAMRSEQQSYKCLREEFPICYEKAVLELVHHSTLSLDQLVEESSKKLSDQLIPGELVQFKVKRDGQAIHGKVIKLLTQNTEGNGHCTSPSSDKENASEGVKVDDSLSVVPKPVSLPFKYNVQLLDQDKIIASVPADDLGRLSPLPTKEMLKLFINSHALRFGTHSSSPWVVEDKLIKRHNLPNKFAEFFVSPHKMGDVSKNSEIKKRKSSSKPSGSESKKSKIDQNHLKPIVRVAYIPETDHKYVKKIISTPIKKLSVSGKLKKKHSKIHSDEKKKKRPSHSSSNNKSSKDSSIPPKKKKHGENSKKENDTLHKKKKKPKSNDSTKSKSEESTKKSKTNSHKVKLKKDVSGTTSKKLKGKEEIKNKQKKQLSKVEEKKSHKKKIPLPDSKNSSPKKSSTPKKKALKQMTLLDMSTKKGKSPSKIKMLSPHHQYPAIVHKIQKAWDEERKSALIQLIARASRELTVQQRNALPSHIKQAIILRLEKNEHKMKLKTLNPEEKIAYLKEKRNERSKKSMDGRKLKIIEKRKIRKELSKRYEDKDLAPKALPPPKLVFTPEGIPNEAFGNVTMVTEFLSCYSELLTPGDNQPITTEALMKNLAAGKEGFLYLNRILVILLQTLLQDQIAEDYKEIKVPLSDVPVNYYTASELMRLCLRKHDTSDTDSLSSSESNNFEEIEDVPESLVSLLETSEFYELEPSQKLELLVGLCHRILSTYSVQDFMEERQQEATKLWKLKIAELKEKNDIKRAEKAKRLEAKKIQENVDNKETKESKTEQNDKVGLTVPHFYGKTEVGEKEVKTEEIEVPSENDSDLASVVKRRRILTAKAQAEREKLDKLDKERREKEAEELRKIKQKELFQKQFEDGLLAARLALRHGPIGSDRNHNHYWLFTNTSPGLYIEKGWAVKDIEYRVQLPTSHQKSSRDIESKSSIASSSSSDSDSDEESLAKISTSITKKAKTSIETTTPACGQNLWFVYDTVKEIDDLIANLAVQGVRESALKVELQKHYNDLCKAINAGTKSVGIDVVLSGEVELLKTFRNELMETETRLGKGGLGGVDNFEKWEKKLNASSDLRELGKCMLETKRGVATRFLQGILAPKKVKVKPENSEVPEAEAKESEEEVPPEGLAKWIEAVEAAPTFSRLHVLLGMLDASIKWEKSAENAKCKICRKKGDDVKLLLCDDCNQAFHLYCLRPALPSIPKGDWLCPACQPASAKRTSRTSYKERDSSDEEEESEREEVENELECSRCGGDEGLVNCCSCPAAYHKECHIPPLRNTPRSWWKCRDCIVGKVSKATRRMRAKLRNKKQSSGREPKPQIKKCYDVDPPPASKPSPDKEPSQASEPRLRPARQQISVNENGRASSRRQQASEVNSSSHMNNHSSRKRAGSPELETSNELKKQVSQTKNESVEPKKRTLAASKTKNVQINQTEVDIFQNNVSTSKRTAQPSVKATHATSSSKTGRPTSIKTVKSVVAKTVQSSSSVKVVQSARASKPIPTKPVQTTFEEALQSFSPPKPVPSNSLSKTSSPATKKIVQSTSYVKSIQPVSSAKTFLSTFARNAQATTVKTLQSSSSEKTLQSPAKILQSNSFARSSPSNSLSKTSPSNSLAKSSPSNSLAKSSPSNSLAKTFLLTSPIKIVPSTSFSKTAQSTSSPRITPLNTPLKLVTPGSPPKMISSVFLLKVCPPTSQAKTDQTLVPTTKTVSFLPPPKIIKSSAAKMTPSSSIQTVASPLSKTVQPVSLVTTSNSSALANNSIKTVSQKSSNKSDLISFSKPGPSLLTIKTPPISVDKVVPLASSNKSICESKSVRQLAPNSAEDNKICEEILQKIMRSRFSWPFRVPIDKKQYPDYFDIIENPLDFHIIKNKCLCIEYNTSADFIADVHLVLNNARQYPKFQAHAEIQECIIKVEEQMNDLLSKNFPNYKPASNSWHDHAYSNVKQQQ